jgi:hypothetical protein
LSLYQSGVHVLLMFYIFFTYTSVQHDYHLTSCSYRLTLARRMSIVEQVLLAILEHHAWF